MSDIWYLLNDHERYVYHYTRAKTLIKHILPDGKLRFSKFKDVNDPRECKDWTFNYSAISGDFDRWDALSVEVNAIVKHTARVGCFVRDPPDAVMTGRAEEHGRETMNRAYHRGHSRPRMWAHYAEDHRGACLVFDKEKLDAAIRKSASQFGAQVYSGDVKYRDMSVLADVARPHAFTVSFADAARDGLEAAVGAHVARHWRDPFFVKATDWAQEWEFRWLVFLDHGKRDFFVDVKDSLVGIAFGDRFPKRWRSAVERRIVPRSVELADMSWQNGFPQPLPLLPWGRRKSVGVSCRLLARHR